MNKVMELRLICLLVSSLINGLLIENMQANLILVLDIAIIICTQKMLNQVYLKLHKKDYNQIDIPNGRQQLQENHTC